MRLANVKDIDAIAEIEKHCFPGLTAYSKRRLAYLVLKAHSSTLVETHDDVLCGFIIVLYMEGSYIGRIETIDVDPHYRKKGIALRLLAAAEKEMKQQGMKFSQLEVSEGNKNAIRLYQKAGYTFKKRLVNFYQIEHNGTFDAVQMIKNLD